MSFTFLIEIFLYIIICVTVIFYLRKSFVGNVYSFNPVTNQPIKQIPCSNGVRDEQSGECKCTKPFFKNNSYNGDCTEIAYGFKTVVAVNTGNVENGGSNENGFDVTCSYPYLLFNKSTKVCEMGTIAKSINTVSVCFNGKMVNGECICNDGFSLFSAATDSKKKNVCVKSIDFWNLIDPKTRRDEITKTVKCTLVNRSVIFEYKNVQYCAYIPEIENNVYISLDGTLHLFNNEKCIVSDSHEQCFRVPAMAPITANSYNLNIRPLDSISSKPKIYQMVFNKKTSYAPSNKSFDYDIVGLLDPTNFKNPLPIPMPVKDQPDEDLELQISKIKGLYYNLDNRTVQYI